MGSNPTLRTTIHTSEPEDLVNFGIWLFSRGNRESTIDRKLRYFKKLSGTPEAMTNQVLTSQWKDKVKYNALDAIAQYAEFRGIPYLKPKFRVYNNTKMYVPTPEMVRAFVYRIRSIAVRSMVMLSIETGCSAGECWNLEWNSANSATQRSHNQRSQRSEAKPTHYRMNCWA